MNALPSTLLRVLTPTLSDEQLGALARQLVREQPENRALGAQLRSLLAGTGTAAPAARAPTAFRQVKFRLPDGSRTNITLRASLFQALLERCGSRQAAQERVRTLAARAPAHVANRSGWVADALTKWLATPLQPSLPRPQQATML
jgi:hypothetical protein